MDAAPPPPSPNDRRSAAAFLAQALDLADEPDALAADLVAIAAEPPVAIYAAELDSSVGPAAFLVYAYDLTATDADGRGGQTCFADDLATLERAAALAAPGPRAVAHARGDDLAFILATTPATLRALSGGGEPPPDASPPPADLLLAADPATARREAAAELLRALRLANEQAARWRAALPAPALPDAAQAPAARSLPVSSEETELALFLLDEASIRDLLLTINTIIDAARPGSPRDSERPQDPADGPDPTRSAGPGAGSASPPRE